jgi:hypothetical protein
VGGVPSGLKSTVEKEAGERVGEDEGIMIGYGPAYLDFCCVLVSFLPNIIRYPCDTAWRDPCIYLR